MHPLRIQNYFWALPKHWKSTQLQDKTSYETSWWPQLWRNVNICMQTLVPAVEHVPPWYQNSRIKADTEDIPSTRSREQPWSSYFNEASLVSQSRYRALRRILRPEVLMLFQGDSYDWILLWHLSVSTASLSLPTGIIPAKPKEKQPPYLTGNENLLIMHHLVLANSKYQPFQLQ